MYVAPFPIKHLFLGALSPRGGVERNRCIDRQGKTVAGSAGKARTAAHGRVRRRGQNGRPKAGPQAGPDRPPEGGSAGKWQSGNVARIGPAWFTPWCTAQDHLPRPNREVGAPKPTKGEGALPAQGADRSSGVLYCTILYYTVLYCTILYYTVLYCSKNKQIYKKISSNC